MADNSPLLSVEQIQQERVDAIFCPHNPTISQSDYIKLYTECGGTLANQVSTRQLRGDFDASVAYKIYHRVSWIIRYVNGNLIGEDSPKELHDKLIPTAVDIEQEWERQHSNPGWRKEKLKEILHITQETYKELGTPFSIIHKPRSNN